MKLPFTVLTLGVVLQLAPPARAASTAPEDKTIVLISDLEAPTAPPQRTVRGVIAAIDERNDRISLRLPNDDSEDFKIEDFKVRDGLVFNSVRFGDQVEVVVESVDGARTIIGLTKE
jgi:hypothetical protein